MQSIKTHLDTTNEIYLKVKILPNSPKNEYIGLMDDNETHKIRIKAVPEKGKANKELINFLKKELGISQENIYILSGSHDRTKLIKIKK